VAQKANLSFKNKFHYISVIDEASDIKFGMQLVAAVCQGPSSNLTRRTVGVALG